MLAETNPGTCRITSSVASTRIRTSSSWRSGATVNLLISVTTGCPVSIVVDMPASMSASRSLLLILDNFEHLVEAAPLVGAILAGRAPGRGAGDEQGTPHAPGGAGLSRPLSRPQGRGQALPGAHRPGRACGSRR